MDPQHLLLEHDPAVFEAETQLFPPLRQFGLDLGLDRSQLLRQRVELRGHVFVLSGLPVAAGGHGTAADATHSGAVAAQKSRHNRPRRLSIAAKIPKFRPCRKHSEKAAPKPVAVKALAKGDHVFLVDGSSYIFRAYHALPPLNRKSDGLQVNAVLGFCNMLWKLLRDMPPDNRPTHLAIVFDKSEVTFRNKLYPDYKAHRPPAPDDLIPQFPLIREAVRAFDLPCLEQGGFEADDLIATYAREAGERGATTTIVSSDKDLMQLVTDKVTMYDTMKDRRIGIAEVIEKFGVPPEKVVEVQALAGDSTDNVPGVPGIGIKTAAQLIVEYGDLETLLARAGEIKQPKRREALIENAEKARISRQLVLLDDKVKLDVPLDELAVHEPDARKLIAFLKAMEFSTLTRRVARIFADRSGGRGSGCATTRAARAASRPAPRRRPRARREATCSGIRTPRPRPRSGKASAPAPARGQGKPDKSNVVLTPQALAAARAEEARKTPVDRSKYQTIRSLDRAQRLDRAGARCRPFRDRGQGEFDRSDAGRDVAALRWRWRPTTPATSRSATSNPAMAPACSPPASRRTRSRPATRSKRCGRCWNRPAFSRSASTSSSTP